MCPFERFNLKKTRKAGPRVGHWHRTWSALPGTKTTLARSRKISAAALDSQNIGMLAHEMLSGSQAHGVRRKIGYHRDLHKALTRLLALVSEPLAFTPDD